MPQRHVSLATAAPSSSVDVWCYAGQAVPRPMLSWSYLTGTVLWSTIILSIQVSQSTAVIDDIVDPYIG